MTSHEDIVKIERSLLKALCQGHLRGAAATRIRARLADYKWREPLHQVIFGALLSIPFTDPNFIRDLLAARLTLRGFPDVNFEDLFNPIATSPESVEQLVDRLLEAEGPNQP